MRTNPKTSRRRSSSLSRRGFSTQSFSGSQPDRRRLVFEPLEDRRLLAVFSVSNLNDAGADSLRDAIDMANAAGGADEIQFSVNGTIALASQLPTITDDLTISGAGQDLLTLDAGNGTDNIPNTGDGYRVFNIDDGDNNNEIFVEVSGLRLTGGDLEGSYPGNTGGAILNLENLTVASSTLSGNSARLGGGIKNEGTVTITSSTLSDNSASPSGGGIWNRGTVLVTNSTLSGNSATSGGGIYNRSDGTATITSSTLSGNSATSSGGGIKNEGTVTVTSSTLSDNSAISQGGGITNGGTANVTNSNLYGNSAHEGGGIYNDDDGTANVTSSTLSGNSADNGGGIFNRGTATITSSTLSGNSADDGGGILNFGTATVTNSTLSGNTASFGGGGITNGGTVTVTNSTLSDNSADDGGGIRNFSGFFNVGTVTVSSSTISGNSADRGGGIHNYLGTATITSSTISGNSADQGGGIYNKKGTATITSSTLSGNSARFGGGGIHNEYSGRATVTSSTLSGNSADYGSGISNNLAGRITLENTIVANSSSGGDIHNTGFFPDSLTGAYNLIEDGSGGGGLTDTISGDPLLGPLANNGGSTQTHALLPGSPAIDAGDPTIQQDLSQFDQRGDPFLRVADGDLLTVIVIDIGAYEAQAPPSADFDSDNDVDGFDFLTWQRGYGITTGATKPDGNSDDDEDVDNSDLAAWGVSFGNGNGLMVASSMSNQIAPAKAAIISVSLTVEPIAPMELIDAVMAMERLSRSIGGDETVVVEEELLAETIFDPTFAPHELAQPSALSVLRVSRPTSLAEPEETLVEWSSDDAVDEVFERVFG